MSAARFLFIGLALLLAAAGLVMPGWLVSFLAIALGNGLVVVGLVVLWRAGLVSFGQALYFALGAYAVALTLRMTEVREAFILIAIAMLVSGIAAFLIGFLLARYREIFFAMLSLALSMILYGVLVKSEALGSTDGFSVGEFTVLGAALEGPARGVAVYWVALGLAAIATVGVSAYWRSVAGAASVPLRENEIRVEYLGVSANRLVHLKIVLAGVLAGAGGAIVAMSVRHVDPNMAYWTTSGVFVFVAILAGASSAIGGFIGAIAFEILRTVALAVFPGGWQLILGGVLLATIMFMPQGLGALLTRGSFIGLRRQKEPGS